MEHNTVSDLPGLNIGKLEVFSGNLSAIKKWNMNSFCTFNNIIRMTMVTYFRACNGLT